jgi:2'-hydroxyisoflavone reductase
MKILILGGTQFIGRHIAECLLESGHTVSVFNRGQSSDDLPSQVERLRGDRDQGREGLNALVGRTWDACIDVSGYTPRQVRTSAEELRDSVTRYVYVSAVSAYGDRVERPVRETQPLLPPAGDDVTEVNGETYGPLKSACEGIVRQVFGERATVLRPQVVVGPHDSSGRYEYWIGRAWQGGEMLAPGDGTDHLQVIDVRDLARFVATGLAKNIGGEFNLAGPRFTWAAFMSMISGREPVWVPASLIRDANLTFVELPLYRPDGGARSSLMDVSNERACAAGLTLTDPATSIRDMQAWMKGRAWVPSLDPSVEQRLIRLAQSAHEY